MADNLLASLGVILTAATGFALVHIYRHPFRWWLRRQAAKRRAAQLRRQKEAFANLGRAFDEFGAAFTTLFVPVVEGLTVILDGISEAFRGEMRK